MLVYTVHKAGSMFLHQLTGELCALAGLRHCSINLPELREKIRDRSWKGVIEADDGKTLFGPIRAGIAEPDYPGDLEKRKIVLHVRDPRDVLTSLFFSHTYSHAHREGGFSPSDEERKRWENMGVDEFVIERAGRFVERYDSLCETLLRRPNTTLLHYEQMVTDYGRWLDAFMECFAQCQWRKGIHGWFNRRTGFTPEKLAEFRTQLFEKHKQDFQTDGEDTRSHKRQVTPGDHTRKLQPQTITRLNQLFAGSLENLGYAARHNFSHNQHKPKT